MINWVGCSCRVFKYFYDMKNPPEGLVIPHKPRDIAQKGTLGSSRKYTNDYVHGHVSTISKGKPDSTGIFHNSAMKFAATNEVDSRGLQITRDMLFVVYAESKIPVTYGQHPTLVEALKLLNLGDHHYSKSSATKMTK